MTGTEAIQFIVITAILLGAYRWLWTWNEREQRNALIKNASAKYPVALTGSMFAPSFEQYIETGSTVYIPACDGMYSKRVKTKKRLEYHAAIKRWLKSGAIVHLVVTRPNEGCREEWQACIDAYPYTFFVHLLSREQASGEAKSQIEKLDTFHPVLLVNPQRSANSPGAIWIEGYHPIGSKYAYDVTFVSPADATLDGRFSKYREMYERLLVGPHATKIAASELKALAA